MQVYLDFIIDLSPISVDTQIIPIGTTDALVAAGFWSTFISKRTIIHQELSKIIAKYPQMDIVITGHGFGGGWALLEALDLKLNYNQSTYLYTYGQPVIGNSVFGDSVRQIIGSNHLRVVNLNDFVPHTGFLNGSHGSQEIFTFECGYDSLKVNSTAYGAFKCEGICSNYYNCLDMDWRAHTSLMGWSLDASFCNISAVSSSVYH